MKTKAIVKSQTDLLLIKAVMAANLISKGLIN
jgi:hypothetical protein